MDHEKELDRLLNRRAVPEMHSHLEHRILQASLQQDKKIQTTHKVGTLFKTVRDFMDCLVLPQPVLSMAMVLVIGAALGAYSTESYTAVQGYGDDVETFVMTTVELEYGDFL
tara:strand:- start:46561 stop:46896 length:336 start_codon:yes stop_codon:yes gene_type:complete